MSLTMLQTSRRVSWALESWFKQAYLFNQRLLDVIANIRLAGLPWHSKELGLTRQVSLSNLRTNRQIQSYWVCDQHVKMALWTTKVIYLVHIEPKGECNCSFKQQHSELTLQTKNVFWISNFYTKLMTEETRGIDILAEIVHFLCHLLSWLLSCLGHSYSFGI